MVLGIFALGYQGVSDFPQEPLAQVASVRVMETREHTVWLPPIIGITSLVVGGLLIVLGRREHAT